MRYLLVFLMGFFSVASWANDPLELRHFGSDKAPVHMYLFTSVVCPHCATFYKKILPDIQSKFVKTGKVYLTKIEMPVNKISLQAAALVRCQSPEVGEKLEGRFYNYQKQLTTSKNERDTLWDFAKSEHISQADFDQCLNNGRLMDKILEQRTNLSNLYGVEKMPTVVMRSGEAVIKIEGSEKQAILESLDDLLKSAQ